VCTMNTARRPSWLRVAGVSIAIFVTVLALLWFRVSAGADPVLSAQTSSGQAMTTTQSTTTSSDDTTSSEDSSGSSSSSDIPTTSAS
jgi:cytoskeletal protein RodZ